MGEKLLFLTGRLAYPSLCRELEGIELPGFDYQVHNLGLAVAALMTADMIGRRLADTFGADRIIVPGLCSGDLDALSARLGVPVVRGPKELRDLPEFFGRRARAVDLSEHRVTLFAEIVDAPERDVAGILARAAAYRADGADVIDLGCLPGRPFPHLEQAVAALREAGHRVSVDSLDTDELLRGGRAGADYLLSLKESTLWIAEEVASTPVLIPERPGDLDSLVRAAEALAARGRGYLADPILDPIHFGFTRSLLRYARLRERLPDAPIMMGTGNVTELTDADTTGITAVLFGIVSELDVAAVLTTEVSPHARTVVRESDRARRMLWAAKRMGSLPKGIDSGLLAVHERKPFAYSPGEIGDLAAAVGDPSYRIQVSEAGIHVYNREVLHTAPDPFDLFPKLGVDDDGGHAFYLGVELGRAQIAFQLGKRYVQDQPLGWGCVVPERGPAEGYDAPGSTLHSRRKR